MGDEYDRITILKKEFRMLPLWAFIHFIENNHVLHFGKDIIALIPHISKGFVIGDVDFNTNDTPFEKKRQGNT